MDILSVLKLFGGVGLFLFGMSTMSSSLKKLAGSSLGQILERLTTAKNKAIGAVKGWGLGAGVTAVIQSSAAVTIMLISFVNAGLMTLAQAVPVVFGSNVGSTVTAQILRLGDLGSGSLVLQLLKPSSFAPVLVVIGAFILLFSKKKKVKDIAEIAIGLGVLFYGMTMMEEVFKPLRENATFQAFFTSFENPFIGILTGLVLTALIQSSSASVGILQALSATGTVTYATAIPIIIGQNIGKCFTTILGSVGANRKAKRVSLSYLFFNLFGALFFTVIIYVIYYTVGLPFFAKTVNRGNIADLHLMFNLITSIILLPFSGKIGTITEKVLPDNAPSDEDREFSKLDDLLLNTPGIALQQCRSLMRRMSEKIVENYRLATGLIYEYNEKDLEQLQENEDFIDRCESVLSAYVIRIDKRRLTRDANLEVAEILNSISDFERIGDYCVNISFAARDKRDNNINFSPAGQQEADTIIQAASYITETLNSAFQRTDAALARRVQPLADVIENLKDLIKSHHVERLQEGTCSVQSGVVLLDLINSMERIGSHAANIALHIIKRASADSDFDEMHGHSGDVATEEYQALYTYYESRYLLPVSRTVPPVPVIPDPENYAGLEISETGVALPPDAGAPSEEKKKKKDDKAHKDEKSAKDKKSGKKKK